MTPKLLTVSWRQPENPLGGKQHVVRDGRTLCGIDVPKPGADVAFGHTDAKTLVRRWFGCKRCHWKFIGLGEKGMEG